MYEKRTIMELATSINDLSDFILHPHLYDHHGARLCDSGRCQGRSVMIVEGSHMCAECLAEYNAEHEEEPQGISDQEYNEDQVHRYGPLGGI